MEAEAGGQEGSSYSLRAGLDQWPQVPWSPGMGERETEDPREDAKVPGVGASGGLGSARPLTPGMPAGTSLKASLKEVRHIPVTRSPCTCPQFKMPQSTGR